MRSLRAVRHRAASALAALLVAASLAACSSAPVPCGGGSGPYTLANLPCGRP